jgi:hypothetical protein
VTPRPGLGAIEHASVSGIPFLNAHLERGVRDGFERLASLLDDMSTTI